MDRIRRSPGLVSLAAIALVVTALWLAKPVLLPLALALLASMVLAPLVRRVERLRMGRIPAVILVALSVAGALVGTGWVIVDQAVELTSDLPDYRQNARVKLRSLVVEVRRAQREVEELEREIAETTRAVEGGEEKEKAPKVEVVESEPGVVELARSHAGALAAPLATGGLAVVLLIFILVQQEDLSERLIRVLGSRDPEGARSAVDEAGQRVTRYLRAYALLNAGHGLVVGVGLWLFGLPAAALFGLLAALLRFVPYLGPWVAATLPIVLSVAVFESWVPTLGVVLFLAAVELVSNNAVEPWLYGSSVGLSPFAVVISAVFWTWLWGPVGLVLSTPIGVCLVILGRRLPSLEFFATLLEDEPPGGTGGGGSAQRLEVDPALGGGRESRAPTHPDPAPQHAGRGPAAQHPPQARAQG